MRPPALNLRSSFTRNLTNSETSRKKYLENEYLGIRFNDDIP